MKYRLHRYFLCGSNLSANWGCFSVNNDFTVIFSAHALHHTVRFNRLIPPYCACLRVYTLKFDFILLNSTKFSSIIIIHHYEKDAFMFTCPLPAFCFRSTHIAFFKRSQNWKLLWISEIIILNIVRISQNLWRQPGVRNTPIRLTIFQPLATIRRKLRLRAHSITSIYIQNIQILVRALKVLLFT